jgi:hypothetical protein
MHFVSGGVNAMQSNKIKHGGILVAVSLLVADPAFAMDFGNVMNPTKWFGGNRDRYDDDYYDEGPGYGGYPPPGGYGGPYGAPGFGYPGYGAPGYGGYGAPGYGAPGVGAPGYGYPGVGPGVPGYTAPAYSAPESSSGSDSLEVERLKRRIRELEEQTRQSSESASGQYGYQQPPMPTPAPYGGAQQGYAPPPAGGYGSEGYGAGQPGYGGQPSYGTPPGGQGNKWYYREDASLPPVADQ